MQKITDRSKMEGQIMTDTIYLIHSGDKSSYMWPVWYYHYKKYYTCEYDTIFLSENKSMDFPGVKFQHTGDVPWADGLMTYLEKITAKYIIYTHEDYFLTEPTNCKVLKDLIKLMDENDMRLLKCCGHWAGSPEWHENTGQFIETNLYENVWRYANKNQYLISHQTSIWSRDLLYTTLKIGEDPWGHELMGTDRLRARNLPIYAYRGKSPLESAETMVSGEIREGCEHYFVIEPEEK